MFKILALPICFCSFAVFADTTEEACLGIQKLPSNTLAFFYNQQNKADAPYFYIKAMTGNETPGNDLSAIMAVGKNLTAVQHTKPIFYQLPEQAKKLYIIKTPVKIATDPQAQVVPVINNPGNVENGRRRNVSNDPHPLPDPTTQQHRLQNVTVNLTGLSAEKEKVLVCALAL